MSQNALQSILSGGLPPDVATEYVTDSGTAIPVANTLNVLGVGGTLTSAMGDTIYIDSTGAIGVSQITSTAPLTANGLSGVPQLGAVTLALSTPLTVQYGGTGDSSLTAYAPVCGGTTSTSALQSASTGFSSSGYVLVSNGAAALPSWQSLGSIGVSSVTGTANQITASPTIGDVVLSLTDGISVGSYQATTPPTGGIIMPGKLGVGTNSISGTNFVQISPTLTTGDATTCTHVSPIFTTSTPSDCYSLASFPVFMPPTGVTYSSCIGILFSGSLQGAGTGTTSIYAGVASVPIIAQSGTVANSYSILSYVPIVNSGTATHAYGAYIVGTAVGLSRPVNAVGLYVQKPTVGTSTNITAIFGDAAATLVGIGTSSPTAALHLRAGSATASTAPLKFTSGTVLGTPENGAMEYDGITTFITNSSPTRQAIAVMSSSFLTEHGVVVATAGSTITSTATGTSGQVLTSNGSSADPTFQTLSGLAVTSITGTANQVIVNGTTGTPQTGAITLTLPQSIGTGNSPQFTGLNLSGLTASQAVVTDGSKNLASLAYASTGGTSNIASRDSNGTSKAVNWTSGITSTASSASTLTLTAASNRIQQITGTLNQIAVLPDATTLLVGTTYEFSNTSTGVLAILDDSSSPIASIASGAYIQLIATSVATSAGTWQKNYLMPSNANYGTAGMTVTGTFSASTSVSSPSFLLTGSSSGTISILPQASAGTYNFNLPITAGTSGYYLTSAGGVSSPMTWTDPASSLVTSISATAPITASASVGAITIGLTTPLAVTFGGTGTATAFTAGSVVFAGTSGVYAQDNANFFWDDTNNRLGIGTTSPQYPLHSVNTSAGALAYPLFLQNSDTTLSTATGVLFCVSSTAGAAKGAIAYLRTLANGRGDIYFLQNTVADTSVATIAQVVMVIKNSGNVGIGTTGPTAVLQLKAGTTSASTAPLKFTSGTNMTAAEAGAVEWDGTTLFITNAVPTRQAAALMSTSFLTNHGVVLGAGTATLSATAAGSAGQILVSGGASADPTWTSSTFPTTCAQGDIFYGSATNVISALAKNTTATRYLSNTGTSNNPAWAQVDLTNGVTGVLPNANTTATSANTVSTIVARDGSGNFSAGTITADLSGTATTANNVATATEAADTTCFVTFVTASGTQASIPLKTNTTLTYDASTSNLGATTFTGALTGNASTATALQNARTIGGVSFNGTANIVPQTITSNNEATDTTCFILFITASGTQSLQPKNNTGLTYNSNTNNVGATTFTGALSGNATTATTLATARNIGGVSFDGSAAIVPQTIQTVDDTSDTTCFILFANASGTQSGGQQPKTNSTLTYDASSNILSSPIITLNSSGDTNLNYNESGAARWTIAYSVAGNYLFHRDTQNGRDLLQSYDSGLSAFPNGSVVIGATAINASAQLQADSTTSGFLPPRMTTTQKNAIGTPAAGLIVFDTTLSKLCVYSGAAWQTITSV